MAILYRAEMINRLTNSICIFMALAPALLRVAYTARSECSSKGPHVAGSQKHGVEPVVVGQSAIDCQSERQIERIRNRRCNSSSHQAMVWNQ